MAGNLGSAFWHDDFGFLIDPSHLPVASAADGRTFRDDRLADTLEASGRVPDLRGAPVASWLLPRLVEATCGSIKLDDGEHRFNDGGCLFLKWVAFTKAMKPRAFFNLVCYSNRIVVNGMCMSNTDPADLLAAFVAPLLAQPDSLREWRVSVTDTDPPTSPGKRGRTYRFGWDGARFLGTRDYE